jgi:hypothetical protein
MPMRTDCRHYESRTYANGEVVRKCRIDLAPEAPWRCPPDCPAFERRLADVDWSHGTLVSPPTPDEPPDFGNEDVGALLDEAEDIVNAAVPEMMSEIAGESRPSWWRRLRRR